MLAEGGFAEYALLTTPRAESALPAISEAAGEAVRVPAGKVDEVSAELFSRVPERPLVALGGGRVIDTAKAIAGTRDGRCAAIPTTLSGAELTPFHRTPKGVDAARLVRPELVIADPELMASQPLTTLAASAMNALAHAMEALVTPLASPVPSLAAIRAAELIESALPRDDPDRDMLALGGLLAGYASGCAGIAVHHALCQTIVRTCGTPHAETNAVMLPHTAAFLAPRAPGALGDLARALRDPEGDPGSAAGRASKLAARCGHVRLGSLGVESIPDGLVESVLQHPALHNTPGGAPGSEQLLRLVESAL